MTRAAVDHVCWLVDDAEVTASALRAHGVGSERGMYYPRAGTQHWYVPLLPPQGLELLQVVDRDDAAAGDVGPLVLAAEAAGGGLFAWAVLVDDLEAVAARHGLEVDDYTLAQPDGTLRGWRTATGPPHLPSSTTPATATGPGGSRRRTDGWATRAGRRRSTAWCSRATRTRCATGSARTTCR